MNEVMAGTSPSGGGEQGDRDVDNFVVDNSNPVGNGKTYTSEKCQACGGTWTCDSNGNWVPNTGDTCQC